MTVLYIYSYNNSLYLKEKKHLISVFQSFSVFVMNKHTLGIEKHETQK